MVVKIADNLFIFIRHGPHAKGLVSKTFDTLKTSVDHE